MIERRRRRIRLQDLLGRRVRTANGEIVGRIEEVRAVRRNDGHDVSEYVIGTGALLERLAVVQKLFGRKPMTLVARWDQLDVRRPDRPMLTCARSELKMEE